MELRDCVNDEQLNIYLDGELTGAEKATVEAHINTCDQCAARTREMRGVGEALKTVTMKAVDEADFSQVWSRVRAEAFPPKPVEEPRRSWLDGLLGDLKNAFSPAFAVAVVIIVAAIVYYSGWLQPVPTPPQPIMEAAIDSKAQIFSIESDSRAVMVLQSTESGATIIIVSDIGSETETNQEPSI
ncbi:MAG: zf-HC2 domain-containing protein [Nitrospirota bacterium]|nr:zf-HC2 domain-containing protein [Nitrospirota bacterium]